MSLPAVPVVETTPDNPLAAMMLEPQITDLLASARRRYTPMGLRLGDAISRRWLARNANPYLLEIDALARRLARPGAHLLNTSYEWACTTGTCPSGDGGQVLARVLDWDLGGLGRNLAVFRRIGPAGPWLNIGWPGFSGVITGLAPGRFAVAINQPPMPMTAWGATARRRSPYLGLALDWLAARPGVWRSRALPAAHLLRRVFDEARDYQEAVAMLRAEPISAPAFFIVSGMAPGEGCVIERTRDGAEVRAAAPTVAAANHWEATTLPGAPRWQDSALRQAQLNQMMTQTPPQDLFAMAWLSGPVLNR